MHLRPFRATSRPTAVLLAALVAAVVLVTGWVWVHRGGDEPERPAAAAPRTPVPTVRDVARTTTLAGRPLCTPVRRGFTPTSISIPGVTRRALVVTPPRDANDIPGAPPLTTAGKELFAWDLAQGTRPGDRKGNVLLSAHAWPDGSALGNRMSAQLGRGDRVVVRGDGKRLCYRVTERVEVLAADGLPRYYQKDGRPQLAILTCSGRRLGPGHWEKRTVWFASPTI